MAACIIPTTQQARANVFHINEPVRAHWTIASTDVVMKPRSPSSSLPTASGEGRTPVPPLFATIPSAHASRKRLQVHVTAKFASRQAVVLTLRQVPVITRLRTSAAKPLLSALLHDTASDAALAAAVLRIVAIGVAALVDDQGATLHV